MYMYKAINFIYPNYIDVCCSIGSIKNKKTARCIGKSRIGFASATCSTAAEGIAKNRIAPTASGIAR